MAEGYCMKKFLIAGALALGSWTGAAQAVTVITYTAGSGTPAPFTTVVQNFDSLAPGASIGTNAFAYGATNATSGRPAFGSTGNYAAVQQDGSYSITFGPTNVFSFAIGSLDFYNTLTLRYADGSSFTYNGGAIVNDPSFDSGNRTSAETNGVVTYVVTSGPLLTGATFTSRANSFEFDNLAVGVPEPAAWGMMILGFGLVGGAMRRRPAKQLKVA